MPFLPPNQQRQSTEGNNLPFITSLMLVRKTKYELYNKHMYSPER